MAAPPPKGSEEQTAITFGIAAMDEHLKDADLDFPADKPQILQQIGDRAIAYDPQGNCMSLESAIHETGRQRFESRQDLLNALHPVFEDRRTQGGLGSWVQSLIPF